MILLICGLIFLFDLYMNYEIKVIFELVYVRVFFFIFLNVICYNNMLWKIKINKLLIFCWFGCKVFIGMVFIVSFELYFI